MPRYRLWQDGSGVFLNCAANRIQMLEPLRINQSLHRNFCHDSFQGPKPLGFQSSSAESSGEERETDQLNQCFSWLKQRDFNGVSRFFSARKVDTPKRSCLIAKGTKSLRADWDKPFINT